MIGDFGEICEERSVLRREGAELEDGGRGRGFEEHGKSFAEAAPNGGARGVVEDRDRSGLGFFSEAGEVARIAFEDFRSAAEGGAKLPFVRAKELSDRRKKSLTWGAVLAPEHGDFRSERGASGKDPGQARVKDIEGQRGQSRFGNLTAKSECAFGGGKGSEEAAAGGWSGKCAEIETRDDGKSAERGDQKFVKVVSGDVFDDAAAAFAKVARAVDEFGANEKIAGGAVKMAERRIGTRGDDAADSAAGIPGDKKREKLMVFEKSGIQVRKQEAGIGAEGEIAGIVVGDVVDGGHVEGEVVARGRHADAEFGAIAARNEGEFLEGSEADDFGDFFGGGGFGDGRGRDFIDSVFGASCGVEGDVSNADGGFEACGEVRAGSHLRASA